ncbi:hypothetical protein AURDEDRAFT_123596 [Auricularia subglabra TFB-10046 SS5]|nr:hypothetical protein AURDEDRAFT_123596 [Auricularia subglabra TFB-10046 SS5]
MSTTSTSSFLRVLPFDVLHATLQYLPQPDLRKAASASRAFREAAMHAGLYIHRSVLWDSAFDIQAFLDVVEYAENNNSRISFQLDFEGYIPDSRASKDAAYDYSGHIFQHLAEGVARALPYLVFLRLTVPDHYRKDIDGLLCRPAPHLRTFEICDFGNQGIYRGDRLVPLPRNIFSGNAPKLRTAALEFVPLPPGPLAAFSHVTHLRLELEDIFPAIDVPRQFPALDSLYIDYYRDRYSAPKPQCVFRGLQLSVLTIDTNAWTVLVPMISETLDLTLVPVIKYFRAGGLVDAYCWSSTLRARDLGELHATITGNGVFADDGNEDVDIIVSPPLTGWRREFCIRNWSIEDPFPLLSEGTGLVTLRLENMFIPGLLDSGVSFPVLRDYPA